MYTLVREEDRLSTTQAIYEFISKVFCPSTKYCFSTLLHISLKDFPNLGEFFEWEHAKKFTIVSLTDGTADEKMFVLDRVENIETLYFEGKFQGELYHKKVGKEEPGRGTLAYLSVSDNPFLVHG